MASIHILLQLQLLLLPALSFNKFSTMAIYKRRKPLLLRTLKKAEAQLSKLAIVYFPASKISSRQRIYSPKQPRR